MQAINLEASFEVEAYVASWIEIFIFAFPPYGINVEAYVASWIEITKDWEGKVCSHVEAYVASWIEMLGFMLM